jgi:hypothetical protein
VQPLRSAILAHEKTLVLAHCSQTLLAVSLHTYHQPLQAVSCLIAAAAAAAVTNTGTRKLATATKLSTLLKSRLLLLPLLQPKPQRVQPLRSAMLHRQVRLCLRTACRPTAH